MVAGNGKEAHISYNRQAGMVAAHTASSSPSSWWFKGRSTYFISHSLVGRQVSLYLYQVVWYAQFVSAKHIHRSQPSGRCHPIAGRCSGKVELEGTQHMELPLP